MRFYFSRRSYLQTTGWFLSAEMGYPVDSSGEALPWWTYPCIEFLNERLRKEHRLFEYGSGNSTVWLSKRVGSVISVEHDQDWFQKVSSWNIENCTVILSKIESGEYTNEVLRAGQQFDIVIIDGRFRTECLKNCIKVLSEDGVVIFDNSDRPKYREAVQTVLDLGFKKLDFRSLSPIAVFPTTTSVMYRAKNCLGI